MQVTCRQSEVARVKNTTPYYIISYSQSSGNYVMCIFEVLVMGINK